MKWSYFCELFIGGGCGVVVFFLLKKALIYQLYLDVFSGFLSWLFYGFGILEKLVKEKGGQ